MKAFLCVILPLILAASVPGDGIEGCTGFESPFALGDQQPELAATVPNGKKYTLGMLGNKVRLRWKKVLHRVSEGNCLRNGLGLRYSDERRTQSYGEGFLRMGR